MCFFLLSEVESSGIKFNKMEAKMPDSEIDISKFYEASHFL